MRGVQPSRPSGTQLAWAIIGSLMVASVALCVWALDGLEAPHDSIEIPWWGLAIVFGLAESWVVHLHFRSETGSFSLMELPLVLGLVFCAPQALWLAVAVGVPVALVMVRHQPWIKVAFNLANLTLHAAIAALLVHNLLGSTDPLEPIGWLILGLATTFAGGVQILNLTAVIGVTEGTLRRRQVITMLATAALISSANTAQALVAGILIDTEPLAILLLGATVVVLFTAYRAYVSERDQRERVEFLYSSTKALRDSPETTTAVAALLDEAASMFRAARADLLLFPGADDPTPAVWFRYEGGTTVAHSIDAEDPLTQRLVAAADEPIAAQAGNASDMVRELLGEDDIRDAMVGTLHGTKRDVGLLVVANRLGNVTTFTQEDLRLFGTLVQQAAVAFENDQLEQALSQMRRLEQDLAHQASHDSLTGLANRALFNDRLAETLSSETSVSVLYIDLDDFKVVNDSLGHEAGDHVLSEVGRRITNVIRPSDTVARLGGDEFAVLLPASDQPEMVARRIIQSLHEPVLIGDHDVQVGASVGLATSQGVIEPSLLLNEADVAMYAAKSNGKGSVVEFRPAMRDQVIKQRRIRTQLRRAIDLDEFDVVYQPIVSLIDDEPVGAEALVRWNAADGVQMPGVFINEAERAGLIVPIDRNVLGKVVGTLGRFPTATARPLFVSVNLSARNFQQDDLLQYFVNTLMDGSAEPQQLVAEITETALLQDPDRTVAQLTELRELGVRVALDDFGTGYSSLSYLRRLPVDILKIAQPFVADVAGDDTFVRTMIDLGKNLGLTIVAEGIETVEQRDVLAELGCDLGQGYLFARPMSREDLLGTIVDQRGTPTGVSDVLG